MLEITGDKNCLKFLMHPKAKIDIEKIPELIAQYRGQLKFRADNEPCFTYTPRKTLKNTTEILHAMNEIVSALQKQERL